MYLPLSFFSDALFRTTMIKSVGFSRGKLGCAHLFRSFQEWHHRHGRAVDNPKDASDHRILQRQIPCRKMNQPDPPYCPALVDQEPHGEVCRQSRQVNFSPFPHIFIHCTLIPVNQFLSMSDLCLFHSPLHVPSHPPQYMPFTACFVHSGHLSAFCWDSDFVERTLCLQA